MVGVDDELPVGVAELVGDPDSDPDGEAVGNAVRDAVGEPEPDADTVEDLLPVPETVAVEEPVGEPD